MPIVNDTARPSGQREHDRRPGVRVALTDPIESGKEVVRMAGQNDGGFEKRVTPAETGSH